MKKKILSLSIVTAVLLVPISQAMAQNSATSGSVDLTNVITENQLTKFTSPIVSPAVDVGGGTWDYGTSWVFPLSKKVWSNYNHRTKIHSSTASKVHRFRAVDKSMLEQPPMQALLEARLRIHTPIGMYTNQNKLPIN